MRTKMALLVLVSGLTSLAATCSHDPRVDVLLTMDQQRARDTSEVRDADQNRAIQNLAQRVKRIEDALSAVAASAEPGPAPNREDETKK
jgi:hypothetical protein